MLAALSPPLTDLTMVKAASVIVSVTFGHLQYSSLELYTLKPCPI